MPNLVKINSFADCNFPLATKASERNRVKSFPGSWKAQREALGITKDTPIEVVKREQAAYNETVRNMRQACKTTAAVLMSHDGWQRMDAEMWQDKRGFRHSNIRLSEVPIKEAGKGGKSATAKAVEIQNAYDKAIEAAAAKLVAAGKFATLEEAKAFLA